MKPPALLALALLPLAAACGGGTARLSVTSDDAAQEARSLGLATPSLDLTTVRSVTVTVDEVWARVDPAAGEATDAGVPEGDDDPARWHRVWAQPREVDLMTVREGQLAPLGDVALPAGLVTQLRLVLAARPEPDQARVAGAVLDADGSRCDLLLPLSAWSPGVKVSGAFRPWSVVPGSHVSVVLNLQLKDSARVSGAEPCAFRLNPVLRLAQGGEPPAY